MVGNWFEDHLQATINRECCACLHSIQPFESISNLHVPVVVSRLRTFAGHRIGLLPPPLSSLSSTPTYLILSFNYAFVTPYNPHTSCLYHVLVAILSRALVFIHWPEIPKRCSRRTLLYQFLVSLARQWSSLTFSFLLGPRMVANRDVPIKWVPCKLNLVSCKHCICDHQGCKK